METKAKKKKAPNMAKINRRANQAIHFYEKVCDALRDIEKELGEDFDSAMQVIENPLDDRDSLCPQCGKQDCTCQSDWANGTP